MSPKLVFAIICWLLVGCATYPVPANLPIEPLATPIPASNLPTLYELISTNPDFAFFNNYLKTYQLDQLVADDTAELTLITPTNGAFAQYGWTPSRTDPALIEQLIRHHLIQGVYSADDLLTLHIIHSLTNQPITITEQDGQIKFDHVWLKTGDIQAANGIIHVVEQALIPSEEGESASIWNILRFDDRFDTFRQFAINTGFIYYLQFNYVDAALIPTDDAFAQLTTDQQTNLEDIEQQRALISYLLLNQNGWPLRTPILVADLANMTEVGSQANFSFAGSRIARIQITRSGNKILLDGATISEGDILTANGVVHVLDKVIFPHPIEE